MRRLRKIAIGVVVASMTGLSLASLAWKPFESSQAQVPGSRKAAPRGGWIQVLSTDSQTRRVRDVAGVCNVPLHPQRIVALAFTDELIALGLKPYAMATGRS